MYTLCLVMACNLITEYHIKNVSSLNSVWIATFILSVLLEEKKNLLKDFAKPWQNTY